MECDVPCNARRKTLKVIKVITVVLLLASCGQSPTLKVGSGSAVPSVPSFVEHRGEFTPAVAMTAPEVTESAVQTQTLACLYDGKELNTAVGPLVQEFFDSSNWLTACATSFNESGWRTSASTRCCVGLFQMHTSFWSSAALPDSLYDDRGNVRAAASLQAQQGWKPWDASKQNSHVSVSIGGQSSSRGLAIPEGGLPATT